MQLLEHPVIAAIVAGLILAILIPCGAWLWRRFFRPDIRMVTATERGPTSRESGFTEPAVKITVMNRGSHDVRIKDIRLMFCGVFGAPVAPEAPAGRSHRELPASLAPGSEENWYIPAEELSDLLRSLQHPSKKSGMETCTVKLYTRCTTGTGKVYKGSRFPFSTDSNTHWP